MNRGRVRRWPDGVGHRTLCFSYRYVFFINRNAVGTIYPFHAVKVDSASFYVRKSLFKCHSKHAFTMVRCIRYEEVCGKCQTSPYKTYLYALLNFFLPEHRCFPFLVFDMGNLSQPRDNSVHEALEPLGEGALLLRNFLRVISTLTTSCSDFDDLAVNTKPVLQGVFRTLARQVAQLLFPSDTDGLVGDLHWVRCFCTRIVNDLLKGVAAFYSRTLERRVLRDWLCSAFPIAAFAYLIDGDDSF